ncbi:hypothetical protein ABT263_33145 [Kitasatospora sp. NPDC001603]|uniref:hypothetical protein n=1 Tax=Kitasatospora sp. NPDC001603 TaxID=3154388 RepID=UPI00332A8AAB
MGLPDLRWAAAADYGLDLTRVLLADSLGEHYAEVITALATACPVILATPPTGLPPRTLDRLTAHLRCTNTVLTPGPGPAPSCAWT